MTEPYTERLEAFRKGSARTFELQQALSKCWTGLASNPKRRGEMAAILGIDPAKAEEAFREPLIRIGQGASGSSGVGDIALVVSTWIASEILLGAFKDIAKAKLKSALERLWEEIVKPAFLDDLPQADSLGRPSPPSDNA